MIHRTRLFTALSVLAVLPLIEAHAWAQDEVPPGGTTDFASSSGGGGRLPLQFSARPMTLPQGTLGIDGSLGFTRIQFSGGFGQSVGETFVTLLGGATYGLNDDLQLQALVLPLVLSPEFDIGNMTASATFRFARGDLELGASAGILIPLANNADFGLSVGVPVLLRVGGSGRIDTGAFLGFTFADSTILTPAIPFQFALNINEQLAAGVQSGLLIPDVDFDLLTIPFGLFAAYSLPGPSGPMLDVGPAFSFPLFLQPASEGDKIVTNIWSLAFVGRFYLFM